MDAQAVRQRLKELVAQSGDRRRAMLLMRYADGFTDAEVAAVIGEPAEAVTRELATAIEDLKWALR